MLRQKLWFVVTAGLLCLITVTGWVTLACASPYSDSLLPLVHETSLTGYITPKENRSLPMQRPFAEGNIWPEIATVTPTLLPTATLTPAPTSTPTSQPTATPTPEPAAIFLTEPTGSENGSTILYATRLTDGILVEGTAQAGKALLLMVTNPEGSALVTHEFICDGEGVFTDRITPEECAALDGAGVVRLKLFYADNAAIGAVEIPFEYRTARAGNAELSEISYSYRNDELIICGTVTVPYEKLTLQNDAQSVLATTLSSNDGFFLFTVPDAIQNDRPKVTAYRLIISDDTLRPISLTVANMVRDTLLPFTRPVSTVVIAILGLTLLAVAILMTATLILRGKSARRRSQKIAAATPTDLSVEAAVCNNMGCVRSNNEDNFYLNGRWMALDTMSKGGLFETEGQAESQFYAVFDGMGGLSAGETASCRAAAEIHALMQRHPAGISDMVFSEGLNTISEGIYHEAQSQGVKSGTTLAGCLLENGQIRIAHVGDSRVYRLRDHTLMQLTADHSEVQRLLSMGVITPAQARSHPKRHVITQYLGMPDTEVRIDASITPVAVRKGDRYLLCSDGLSDMVKDAQISKIFSAAATVKAAADELVQAALKNGGKDNVTVLCLFIGGKDQIFGTNKKMQGILTGLAGAVGAAGLVCLAEMIYRLH